MIQNAKINATNLVAITALKAIQTEIATTALNLVQLENFTKTQHVKTRV
jgi:hypothetical protein